MNIKKISVEKIKPSIYNPRKDLQPGDPEYEALKRSILEFGLVEPLVWNKRTGNLVGGHQRFKVLSAVLKPKTLDVIEVDLSDEREQALNVALNKITGAWDMDLLRAMFINLDSSDFDLTLTGFNPDEIGEIVGPLPSNDTVNESEVPPPQRSQPHDQGR